MYELRIYEVGASQKRRTATVKRPGKWYGLLGWIRLWFKLRAAESKRRREYLRIDQDRSPSIFN